MEKVPEVNKEYIYFDDGKIRESRKATAIITEVVAFEAIDSETKKYWEEEVVDCYWLYETTTDYFIKSHLKELNEDVVFVRTQDGGWFSLGWWAGRLDIDGKLTELLNKN